MIGILKEKVNSTKETVKNIFSKQFLLNLGLTCGLSAIAGWNSHLLLDHSNHQKLSNNSFQSPVESVNIKTPEPNLFTIEGSYLNKIYLDVLNEKDSIQKQGFNALHTVIFTWLENRGVPKKEQMVITKKIINVFDSQEIYEIEDIKNISTSKSIEIETEISNILSGPAPQMARGFNHFFGMESAFAGTFPPSSALDGNDLKPKTRYTAFTRLEPSSNINLNINQVLPNANLIEYFNGLSKNFRNWLFCYYLSLVCTLPFTRIKSRQNFEQALPATQTPTEKPVEITEVKLPKSRFELLREKVQAATKQKQSKEVTQFVDSGFELIEALKPVEIRFK